MSSILSTGTMSAVNDTVVTENVGNTGSIGVTLTGTWVATVTFQGSIDGTTFNSIYALASSGVFVTSTTANGSFIINPAGFKSIRVITTAYTSGTITGTIQLGSDGAIINSTSTLVGNSTGARIGNISDRLKVDADISAISGAVSAAFTSKTRVVVQTSTINLVTASYTNVFSYSGSGLLYGFNVEFNNTGVVVRLQIDGETIFDGISIATLNGLLGTGNDAARRQAGGGIVTSSATIDWSLKQAIKYNSSVVVSADAGGGGLLTRSFTQGIFYLSKET